MNAVTESRPAAGPVVSAPFFARGVVIEGDDATHKSRDLGVTFATPKIDLNKVVHPRTEVPPLLNVPLAEIIDFLVETGQKMLAADNPYMQECFDRMASTHILPRSVVENTAKHAVAYLNKNILMAEVEQNFPDPKALDGWVPKQDFTGRKSFVRAFAPRLIHVLPGNSPGVAVKSVAQGAMVKGINLFKMSSADPFTMVAILRTMAMIDPNHPIVKSMSAVYWRGGDTAVEQVLYRPNISTRSSPGAAAMRSIMSSNISGRASSWFHSIPKHRFRWSGKRPSNPKKRWSWPRIWPRPM